MNIRNSRHFLSVAALSLGCAIGGITIAQSANDPAPAAAQEMKLPAGWTEADMQKMISAGTPGKMHEHLMKSAGNWQGKCTMWMTPGSDPITTDCTYVAKPIMDGRYLQVEMTGEIPGMGAYRGMGIYGYSNAEQKFVANWIDNMNTGIVAGEGELSSDGKSTTWSSTYHCPITDKPAKLREIDTLTGPSTKTLETHGSDPKTGVEYKMMSIELMRKD